MPLQLLTRMNSGVLVVDCSGRIVFGEESELLRNVVKDLVCQNKSIVLNLEKTSYIDSGGLGTMVGLYTAVRNSGGAIKLANLTNRVGELLQVTKLMTVFEVFDNELTAVKSFRRAA